MEKTLTSRQFSVLAFTAAVAVKMFMLPSLLVAEAGRNGYIWMLVYVAIDLAALALIAVAAVKAKRSFYELTESVLGRIGARVLLVLCAAYILFKMTLMLSEVNVFFSEAMYENFSWPVYLIPLLAVLAYAAARSPRVVGRTAEITLPFVAASMLLLFVLSATKPDYANLLPVLRESRGAVFDYTLWLGDFSPLAVFIGKIERKKRTGTKLMLAGLAAGLAVVAFTVILSAEYGNISGLIEYGHNLGGLPTHSGSQNFSRLDLLVFAVWDDGRVLKTDAVPVRVRAARTVRAAAEYARRGVRRIGARRRRSLRAVGVRLSHTGGRLRRRHRCGPQTARAARTDRHSRRCRNGGAR